MQLAVRPSQHGSYLSPQMPTIRLFRLKYLVAYASKVLNKSPDLLCFSTSIDALNTYKWHV